MKQTERDVQKELEAQLRFEIALTEISTGFVDMPADQVSQGIQETQRRICKSLGLDRVSLWQISESDPESFVLTHLHQPPDATPAPERIKAMEYFPWTMQKNRARETVVFSRLSDLPPEAARDLESYRAFGSRSAFIIPLSSGGGPVFGVVSFAAMREEREWTEMQVKQLQLIAQVFANALNREKSHKKLLAAFSEIERLKEQLEAENIYLREEASLLSVHGNIVSESTAMKSVLAQAEQVARTDTTVLITGETGTGKELLARGIHNMSSRNERPLMTVNCASLPPMLIESELFGREKGAYTGAMTRMAGRFEIAAGSTIFLDEIAELSPDLQSKLLRVIEEGTFERLGSTKTIHVNVRIIAATNRDLSQEVQQGSFRRDLFYRLNVFPLNVPALRERVEDIPPLVWAFVRQFEKKMGKQIKNIPQRTMDALQRYPWPGNIRELRNIIEHAMILTRSKTLDVAAPAIKGTGQPDNNDLSLESAERRHILTVLQKCGWRIHGPGGAAEVLGLKRTTLHSRMKKLGIKRPPNFDDISS
jgi:transcriptional regulator with GAF, ATPase, and Fis domain